MTARFPRDVLTKAFPGQPRMLAAFEDLITSFEAAVDTLEGAASTASGAAGSAQAALESADGRQPLSDLLTAISALPAEPGAIEQVQAGVFAVRPIDAEDTASLLTREVADSRYLGADHPASGLASRELDLSFSGLPGLSSGERLLRFRLQEAITLTGGVADAATGATGTAVFTMKKNGATAGTASFTGTVGTVVWTDGAYPANSLFEMYAPAPTNSTLDGVSITLTT